jgi:tetratricopeptide (TPR) repeat protein
LRVLITTIVIANLLACGCATVLDNVRASLEKHGKGIFLEDVPEVTDDGSGPAAAALEAVYGFYGQAVTQSRIARRIYDPRTGEARFDLLIRDADLRGFEAFAVGSPDVFRYIRLGFPAVMPAQLGSNIEGAPPWLILVGYDTAMGVVLLRAGKEHAVVSDGDFERILRLNGGRLLVIAPARSLPADVYEGMALSAERRGEWHEADRLFNLAIDHEVEAGADATRLARCYMSIGRVQKTLGNLTAAIEACEGATELKPEDGDTWHCLAVAFFENSDNISETKKIIDRAVKASPERASYYYSTLGDMHLKLGDLRATRAAFELAVNEKVPKDAPPDYEAALLIKLAEVVEKLGFHRIGRAHREKALRK